MKMINFMKIRFVDEYLSEFVVVTKIKKNYAMLTRETENLSACKMNVYLYSLAYNQLIN